MRSFIIAKSISGRAIDVTKLIDIMIIAGLTALMLFHFAVASAMAA